MPTFPLLSTVKMLLADEEPTVSRAPDACVLVPRSMLPKKVDVLFTKVVVAVRFVEVTPANCTVEVVHKFCVSPKVTLPGELVAIVSPFDDKKV